MVAVCVIGILPVAEKIKIWLIGGGGDKVNGLNGGEIGVAWRQWGISHGTLSLTPNLKFVHYWLFLANTWLSRDTRGSQFIISSKYETFVIAQWGALFMSYAHYSYRCTEYRHLLQSKMLPSNFSPTLLKTKFINSTFVFSKKYPLKWY